MTIRVAILDERLREQARENPAALDGIEVVWSGTDAAELERTAVGLSPQVLVLNLDLLGDDAVNRHRELVDRSGAELAIGLYTFARRDVVDRINGERSRAVKSPVSLQRLRSQMMSVIVRDLLQGDAPRSDRKSVPSDEFAPRYTAKQLGRLLEIKSTIACECPNHLAELVQSLLDFEHYSRNCQNKNDADAQMHGKLAAATARARRTMEDALAELLVFENIVLLRLPAGFRRAAALHVEAPRADAFVHLDRTLSRRQRDRGAARRQPDRRCAAGPRGASRFLRRVSVAGGAGGGRRGRRVTGPRARRDAGSLRGARDGGGRGDGRRVRRVRPRAAAEGRAEAPAARSRRRRRGLVARRRAAAP
jgi:hypothetical protein